MLASPLQRRLYHHIALIWSSLTLGLMISWAGGAYAQAETPPTAPPELTNVLSQIDAAASSHNLPTLLQFYNSNFTNTDGLSYEELQKALDNLWQRFPNISYQTQLNSWQRDGEAIVAETTTTITGTQDLNGRDLALTATIISRQRFEGGQIVQQEILTERSQLTSGENPPSVTVRLPEQVAIGHEFHFDAIVQEPLGEQYLLGAAIEEPIHADAYANPTPIDLELLTAGGLFKVGRAPALPDSRWISAVLIREDGMTLITQRLRVVRRE